MSLVDGVEQLRAGLDYHLTRHNVLVSNLAHVDTPAYTPVDLVRDASFDKGLGSAMATTDPGHLNASGTPATQPFHVAQDPQAASADGNGVSLDREAVKIATNQVRYDVIAQLASSELAGLEWAANDGRGA